MIWAMFALAIEPATICEIVDRPKMFEGKLVSLMAEDSVGFEWQKLADPTCPSTPLWFEFAEGRKFPGAKKFEALTKRVTAEVIGRVYSGSCFGHNCFSKTQIVVEEFRGITTQKREIDCEERRVALRAYGFKGGQIDHAIAKPIGLSDRSQIQLLGPDGPLVSLAEGIFQLAAEPDNITILKADPNTGLLTLPPLSRGLYPFVAVGLGFQSVSGCISIQRGTKRVYRIQLPLGV